jgi:hypothetical protein
MTDDYMVSHVSAAPLDASETSAGHGISRLARAVNWVGGRSGLEFTDLTFDGIVARCERRFGLSDWGCDAFLERYRFAIESAQADNRLTTLGRISASVLFNWHGGNRLRTIEHVKRNPHIRDIEIKEPIFILGWYRTATTNLHNLLSLDPNHRVPLCWELAYPLPQHPDPERDRRQRIRRTAQKWALANMIGPDQKYAHELLAEGAEECFLLLSNSALDTSQIMGLLGYTYARGLLERDVSDAYDDLRLQYQILADQRPGHQWVMKCPIHLWFMDDLMRSFPDAKIIQTHRSAAEAIPSVCSLSAIMAQPMATEWDPVRHGEFFREFCRSGIDRAMNSRKRIPSDHILDVRLSDLSDDPVQTVRHVYDHLDLAWPDDMPARVMAHVEEEARHKAKLGGRHKYTAEQFGLSPEGLASEFSDYESRFLRD